MLIATIHDSTQRQTACPSGKGVMFFIQQPTIWIWPKPLFARPFLHKRNANIFVLSIGLIPALECWFQNAAEFQSGRKFQGPLGAQQVFEKREYLVRQNLKKRVQKLFQIHFQQNTNSIGNSLIRKICWVNLQFPVIAGSSPS